MLSLRALLVISLACVAAAAAVTGVQAGNLQVQTSFGPISGYTADNVDHWKGIPYAAPPVGNLRFALPQDPQPWTDPLPTLSAGHICPQAYIDSLHTYLGEEDCLYLDVYAPTNRNDSQPLPVFVWIYGGGWKFGDGIEFGLYDADNRVNNENVIIVAFNYRLSALGFLALNALKNENSGGNVGSWGIYDQLHALKWVQKNIAAFGGDPNQVTIGGESAGAFSSCIHRTSPLSNGLFRGVIMESGTCESEIFFVEQDKSFAWGENYISHLGCDPTQSDAQVLACIRALDVHDIMALNVTLDWTGYQPSYFPFLPFAATVDGVLLPDTPLNLIRSGQVSKVPTLMGTNHDEGSLFIGDMKDIIPTVSKPIAPGDLTLILNHFFNNNDTVNQLVNDMYPLSNFDNATMQCQTMLRDYFFVCPTSNAMLALNGLGANTWVYQFVYKGDWIEDKYLGVYHSAELEFVFDNAWPPLVHSFSSRDQTMSDTFGSYWFNFIRTGDPNNPGEGLENDQPNWPQYTAGTLQTMELDVPPFATQGLAQNECEMWASISQWTPPASVAQFAQVAAQATINKLRATKGRDIELE